MDRCESKAGRGKSTKMPDMQRSDVKVYEFSLFWKRELFAVLIIKVLEVIRREHGESGFFPHFIFRRTKIYANFVNRPNRRQQASSWNEGCCGGNIQRNILSTCSHQ